MPKHMPDLGRIPDPLRKLDWELVPQEPELTDKLLDVVENGSVLLMAVPVCIRNGRKCQLALADDWQYDFAVVTVNCDEYYFRLFVEDEYWGWEFSDADWYCLIRK